MKTSTTGRQPGQARNFRLMNNALTPEILAALSAGSLQCVECSALYPGLEVGSAFRYRCSCGGTLDVEMKFALSEAQTAPVQVPPGISSALKSDSDPALLTGTLLRQLFEERASTLPTWSISAGKMLLDYSGVWRYRELILPAPEQYIISRPEGNTGLYPVGIENCNPGRIGHRQIGLYAGLEHLFLKHEGENPTGSFKDRGMTVGVTMANLCGAQAVACASTGNTAASLASYAAQAGMRAIVFLPAGNVAGGKLAQSLAYGATTIQVEGNFDDAMHLVEQVCGELGIYLLNSLNPFRIEGQKAIGFEILQQLAWQAPDWLVLPAANPFYRSFKQGFARREPVQAQTVATAIKIGNPVSYTRARRVIEESNGIVEDVTDEEILAAKTIID